MCGNYKFTANKAALVDSYPLPQVEDLFASLAGGQAFSKLDLAHAYLQLPLDIASKPLLTINTSKGLYQYRRLPFGVSSAPAIFQHTIESILRGLPHTSVYLDDILVTGHSEKEHLCNLGCPSASGGGWHSAEAKQVCLLASRGRLPGPPPLSRWTPPDHGQDMSHC